MLLWQALLGVAILGAWQALANAGKLDKFFFSRPSDIAARIVQWVRTGSIWPHLLVTMEEAALAFVIGASSGMVLGFGLARSRWFGALLDPYIRVLNALPRVVLAPIFPVVVRTRDLVESRAGSHGRILYRVFQYASGRARCGSGGGQQCAHAGRVGMATGAPRSDSQRDDVGIFEPQYQRRIRDDRGGGRRISWRGARRRLS